MRSHTCVFISQCLEEGALRAESPMHIFSSTIGLWFRPSPATCWRAGKPKAPAKVLLVLPSRAASTQMTESTEESILLTVGITKTNQLLPEEYDRPDPSKGRKEGRGLCRLHQVPGGLNVWARGQHRSCMEEEPQPYLLPAEACPMVARLRYA